MLERVGRKYKNFIDNFFAICVCFWFCWTAPINIATILAIHLVESTRNEKILARNRAAAGDKYCMPSLQNTVKVKMEYVSM
jgi:hypothetical protein